MLGFLFDIASLSLGLVDTWSDLMVGFEFRDNGQTYFFYAVMILFLFGCVSEAIAFIISLESRWNVTEWYAWTFFTIILTPFAPLLPIVSYVMTKLDMGQTDWSEKIVWENDDGDDDADKNKKKNRGGNIDQNEKEDLRGDASRLIDARASASAAEKSMRELDKAITSRLVCMMVLNVQAVTESAPMCLVQLLACGLAEDPTHMQVFSLALSLVSISGKAFQLCRSFVSSVFVFKIAVITHDVFSTSFLFCALFSANVPKDTTWLGLNVTNLTWWWLSLKLCCAIAISVIILCICIYEVSREAAHNTQQATLTAALFVTVYVLGFTPVAMVQEAAKLAWYIPLSLTVAPDTCHWAQMPLLHAFLWGGDGRQIRETTDWTATFDKLRQFMKPRWTRFYNLTVQRSHTSRPRFAAYGTPQYSPTITQQLLACKEEVKNAQTVLSRVQQPLLGSRSVMRADNFLLRARWAVCIAAFSRRGGMSSLVGIESDTMYRRNPTGTGPGMLDIMMDTRWQTQFNEQSERFFAAVDAPALSWKNVFLRMLPEKQAVQFQWSGVQKEFVAIMVVICCCLLTSLLGLLYPFLHAAMYAQYFTTMQIICFVPTCVALAVALCLLPEGVRYLLTSHVFSTEMQHKRDIISTVVDSFFSVPLSVLRAVAIPDEAVPRDAFDAHVSSFLDQRMVGFFGSVGGEFEKLQESFVASQKEEEHDEEIADAAADALKRE